MPTGSRKERADRADDRRVEPLLAALESEPTGGASSRKSSLRWKLVCAAIVLAALVALVIHQAF